jgi:hypothetical protein
VAFDRIKYAKALTANAQRSATLDAKQIREKLQSGGFDFADEFQKSWRVRNYRDLDVLVALAPYFLTKYKPIDPEEQKAIEVAPAFIQLDGKGEGDGGT